MNDPAPFFSVVIPLYNKQDYILETVKSVLDQSFGDFELLIIDDGSTDRSLERLSSLTDSRIRIFQQENGGEPVARNAGIARAAARYIAFLDADDIWLPEFLQTAADDIGANPGITFWSGGYQFLRNTGLSPALYSVQPLKAGFLMNYFDACLKDPVVMPSTSIVARPVLDAAGGFPVGIPLGGDILFWAKIVQTEQLYFNPKVLVTYRREMGNNYSILQTAPPRRLDVLDFLQTRFDAGDVDALRYFQFYSRKSAYRQTASGRPALGLSILVQSLTQSVRHGRFSAIPWFAVECLGLLRVWLRRIRAVRDKTR